MFLNFQLFSALLIVPNLFLTVLESEVTLNYSCLVKTYLLMLEIMITVKTNQH